MMMKLMFVMSCVMMLAVGANAELISNGDFDSPGDWGYAAYPTSPPNWINYDGGLGATGANYGGQDIYGNGDQPAAMKNTGLGTYLQQGFAGVDAGTTGLYTIGLDLGLRQHSHYQRDGLANPTQAGDILTLRVSLWDTTADVELAGQTFERVYPDQPYVNDIDNMTAELFNLTYDNSGLGGHGVAIRLTHLTPLEEDENLGYKTMLLDHVTVATPNQAGLILPAPNGVTGVGIGTVLEWITPTAYTPDEYRVYFGTTEPNSLLPNYGLTELTAGQHPFTATTIDPSPSGDLEYDTNYYWVVDSYESTTRHRGLSWSFATAKENRIIVEIADDFEVNEGDTNTFTVTLNGSVPGADTPITINLNDIADPNIVTISPETLIFTDGNYATAQLVTVTGIENSVVAPGGPWSPTNPAYESTGIAFSVVTTDPSYTDVVVPDNISVKVIDNECGALGINRMDFDSNCIVDLLDFANFAAQWLDNRMPQ